MNKREVAKALAKNIDYRVRAEDSFVDYAPWNRVFGRNYELRTFVSDRSPTIKEIEEIIKQMPERKYYVVTQESLKLYAVSAFDEVTH